MRYFLALFSICALACGDNIRDACHISGQDLICPKDGTSLRIGRDGDAGANGTNGSNGTDAQPLPFSIVAIVDPCGDAPALHDEIFLRLADTTLIASFSQNAAGDLTRFAVLTPGTYITTDGDNCTFSVDAQNEIVSENHHY